MNETPEHRLSRALLLRCAILLILILLGGCFMIMMPGKTHKGSLPPLTDEEKVVAERLKGHVTMLAGSIGERNLFHYGRLLEAARYITDRFCDVGYEVKEKPYAAQGRRVANIEVELRGTRRPEDVVVIGAHYDSVWGSPGANDNGSGVAALIELARGIRDMRPSLTLRFVAFVNEEPPFFMTDLMGSRVYAAEAKSRRERIVAMLSLETIGYYSDVQGSQAYPFPLSSIYPDTGNFLGFVANLGSAGLLRHCIGMFRQTTPFPSEGLAAPEMIQGIGWSDHWAFWQEGYHGVMLTDTALFRYPHYHAATDTPDKLDFERMARVVAGIGRVVEGLVR